METVGCRDTLRFFIALRKETKGQRNDVSSSNETNCNDGFAGVLHGGD